VYTCGANEKNLSKGSELPFPEIFNAVAAKANPETCKTPPLIENNDAAKTMKIFLGSKFLTLLSV
jgi:hypothetical protein